MAELGECHRLVGVHGSEDRDDQALTGATVQLVRRDGERPGRGRLDDGELVEEQVLGRMHRRRLQVDAGRRDVAQDVTAGREVYAEARRGRADGPLERRARTLA